MKPKPGVVVAGKYELERELARGGMGAVWRAMHLELETHVAVKFMEQGLAESVEARDRFKREAKAAAKLRSSHVVQILDFGVDGGTPYIVMELLRGEDLRRRLKKVGRMSLTEAAEILLQASKALRLAADEGIVHRDLKPGNIFLARSGDDEVVKILDFGVAKATRNTAIGATTSSGTLLGSPYYMSPEQARKGRTLDPRGDLFSMAIILFIMVTGEKPFDGDELGDVIVKICTEPAPRVQSIDPDLPEVLDAFFDRALAKDREDRFQTAKELANAFATLASEQEGVPIADASYSGRYEALSETGDPLERTLDTPVDQSALERDARGTLTLATRSINLPMVENRSALFRAGAAATVALLVLAVAWMATSSSDDVAPTSAASGEATAAEPADLQPPTAAAETATASTEPSASAVAQPSASALAAPTTKAPSAEHTAKAAPPKTPARPRPATGPRPKPKPTDPLLGF